MEMNNILIGGHNALTDVRKRIERNNVAVKENESGLPFSQNFAGQFSTGFMQFNFQ